MQYEKAICANLYYKGKNPTIKNKTRIIYDEMGNPHEDKWSVNNKISSNFFGLAVDQLTGYLLGNGITFKDPETKKRLGTRKKPFDQQIIRLGKYAQIDGETYGFWNFDHVDIFRLTEFVPLLDEENGSLSAGIRFWQIAPDKPLRITLYDLNGYTDYIKRGGEETTLLRNPTPYKLKVSKSNFDGMEILYGENYPTFPIVPMRYNEDGDSALGEKRGLIDAVDSSLSNMSNNAESSNLVYWVINNAGGMDLRDDLRFINQATKFRVVHTDDNATALPHTLEAPYAGLQTTLDTQTRELYQQFRIFDSSAVTAGNQTATAIQASYIPLDLKADDFETQAIQFINGILDLAEIDDEPTFTRNQLINKQEEIQSVLLGADYLDEEYITKKILTVLGDADRADEILERKADNDLARFGMGNDGTDGGEENSDIND